MEEVTWSRYLEMIGYDVSKTWKTKEGYYAELNKPTKSPPKGVTNITKQGKVVRLSFKDVENKAIVGNKKITSEVKQKMTPKQEKYLTEKYIRPMVRKMLKENTSLDPNRISKAIVTVLQTDNYRYDTHLQMIENYINIDIKSTNDLDRGDLEACADFVVDIVKALKKIN